MEWFIAVVVVAILGVAAMAAAGGVGAMSKDPVRDTYRQDLPADRPLGADDIRTLKFGITLRGYAMSQVDDVLDRLGREIAQRDAQIAELGGGAHRLGTGPPVPLAVVGDRPVEPLEIGSKREPE
jgi:DivIVA domain-containing protein